MIILVFPGNIIIESMKYDHLLKEKRKQILEKAALYGAYDVRVFGSTARGEDTSESDIDLLVKLEPGRSLLDLGGFLYEIQEILGVPVDVVTEKGLRARIKNSVIKDAKPI